MTDGFMQRPSREAYLSAEQRLCQRVFHGAASCALLSALMKSSYLRTVEQGSAVARKHCGRLQVFGYRTTKRFEKGSKIVVGDKGSDDEPWTQEFHEIISNWPSSQ